MRIWTVPLWALLIGQPGCEHRATSTGVTARPADLSVSASANDHGAAAHDLSIPPSPSTTESAGTAPDAGFRHASVTHLPDAGNTDAATDSQSDGAAPVLKQSSVSTDFLVIEQNEDGTVKRLSALSGAQVSVLCEATVPYEGNQQPTFCKSRLIIKSAPDSDSILASRTHDVPGIVCRGEGDTSCFDDADVSTAVFALPGLPGGLIVTTGSATQDKVWFRDQETLSGLFVLVRRGIMAPLELQHILSFSSARHHETSREDGADISRRAREREPTRTEEEERTDLSVVKKGKRSLPDLIATTQTETVSKFETKPEKRRTSKSKTHYVFDGMSYVSADTALNTAAHCGSLVRHCATGEDCCGGACKQINTTEHCGSCGRVCPGSAATNSEAVCVDPGKGVCSFGCIGAHYDVDGKVENGCEQRDESGEQTDLGIHPCWDQPIHWKGMLLSDARSHQNPTLERRSAQSGAVPKEAKLTASGGLLCQNDFALTIQTRDGQKEACYLLHIEGLAQPLSVTLTGNDEQTIWRSRGAYPSGTALRLRLEKTCPGSAALSFSVSFHL